MTSFLRAGLRLALESKQGGRGRVEIRRWLLPQDKAAARRRSSQNEFMWQMKSLGDDLSEQQWHSMKRWFYATSSTRWEKQGIARAKRILILLHEQQSDWAGTTVAHLPMPILIGAEAVLTQIGARFQWRGLIRSFLIRLFRRRRNPFRLRR